MRLARVLAELTAALKLGDNPAFHTAVTASVLRTRPVEIRAGRLDGASAIYPKELPPFVFA